MRATEALRRAFLRWDRVISAVALALPFGVTSVLGFFWLAEHGVLLWFAGVSIGAGLVLWGLRRLPRWGRPTADRQAAEGMTVDADDEWDATQAAAFAEAKTLIEARTGAPVDWPDMQALALEVINGVARHFGEGGKGALDFTAPEALLLIEQVAARYRADLKRMVPFSDRMSVRTLHWAWQHRAAVRRAMTAGQGAWRVLRMARNPALGIMRELDGVLAGGHSDFLTGQAMAVLQGVLLEEVAKVSVDLYSGRLRFSDAELLRMQLGHAAADRARVADPDRPVRIVLAGQASAGKSTLINALLGIDRAETDMRPTTDRPVAYEAEIEGFPCVLLDLPGLDGGRAAREVVLRELAEADIVAWVVRADRPARAIDRRVLDDWRAWFEARPERRRPPLVPVATCIDRLVEGWPLPEHTLTDAARDRLAEVVRAIGADLALPVPIPVSSVEPEWNLQAVRQAVVGSFTEALMVQRNRLRIGAERRGVRAELARGGRGVLQGSRSLGWRLVRRGLGDGGRPGGDK